LVTGHKVESGGREEKMDWHCLTVDCGRELQKGSFSIIIRAEMKISFIGFWRFDERAITVFGEPITDRAHPKAVDLSGGDDREGCDPPPKSARHQPSGV
jgi:hypothetical protein